MPFYWIAALAFVLDQATKIIVRMRLDVGETVTLWGREWTRFENSGMAGSLFQGYGRLFGVVAVLFVIGVFVYRKKGEIKGKLFDCGLGFLVGGAIGNGFDRLLFGRVTDFIVRGDGILNVADHAIEIGAALVVLSLLLGWIRGKWSAWRS